ncbi:MAG TPA: hypothetical protein VI112_04250 [Bacteroidia bacterium]|jgi:hypothetical protein
MAEQYIGGFFGLEPLPPGEVSKRIHEGALPLQSGRACVSFLLAHLNVQRLYLPFYTCDALVDPVIERGIPFEFYPIDESFFPAHIPVLKEGEYFVYVNYFGLQAVQLERLYQRYGKQLIIDNTTAFFEGPYHDCFSFNSARKFFGVPDGAFLFGEQFLAGYNRLPVNKNISLLHLRLRAAGMQHEAFAAFRAYERTISTQAQKSSPYSLEVLGKLDLENIAAKRRANFMYYHERLQLVNRLKPLSPANQVPHYYPFLPGGHFDRSSLAAEGIFIPTLWPEVLLREGVGFDTDRYFAEHILPLPVDHRYSAADCEKVISLLQPKLGSPKEQAND